MIRIITQVLIGLMLFFGVLTLAARAIVHLRRGDVLRALYFLVLVAGALFFSVMAFYFAYGGLKEL